jgi:hypothetical protein
MSTLQITLPVSQNELLQVVEQLDSEDLNDFVSRVLAIQNERRPDVLSANETNLLEEVNLGISPARWQRYYELRGKLNDETISEAEHQELIAITTEIEAANVRRFTALSKLAALWQEPLDTVMERLGISDPGHE